MAALATTLMLSSVLAQAQEPDRVRDGWAISAAVGRADYRVDCVGVFACSTPRATASKFGVAYQFGGFGLEGWWIDFGRSQPFDTFGLGGPGQSVHMQAVMLDAAWRWRFARRFDLVLRAGVANVQHQRSGEDNMRRVSPHVGIAMAVELTPAMALELAWDATSGRRAGNIDANVSANSLALHFRF